MSAIGASYILEISRDLKRYRREGFTITDEQFAEWEREINEGHGWDGVPPFVTLVGVRIVDADGNQRRWPKASNRVTIGACSVCRRPVCLTRRGLVVRHGWTASQPSTDLRGFDVGRDHTETRPSCTGSGKPPYKEPKMSRAQMDERGRQLARERTPKEGG